MDNRINDLVQTGIKTVEERIEFPPEYDSQGNLVREAFTEVIEHEVPIMETVYRDMTPEEEAEVLAHQAECEELEQTRPRTPEERCDAVEVKQSATEQDVNMLADTVLALCDIIEGGEE